jgi:hypothetical protein
MRLIGYSTGKCAVAPPLMIAMNCPAPPLSHSQEQVMPKGVAMKGGTFRPKDDCNHPILESQPIVECI